MVPMRDEGGVRADEQPPAARKHVGGLDGLRAIAVVAVILYHLELPWAAGGFLGVDIFFVISGYLITSQLWARASITGGGVDLRRFWAARARRLIPALVVVLLATTLAQLAAGRDQLTSYLGDLGAAATYTSNWWYVLHERSYFEAFGRPPALQHLWSLAVEEQFYVVWPLVVALIAFVFRRPHARRFAMLAVCVLGAAASMLVMGVGTLRSGAPLAADASRFYFGTDSHSAGLLVGAALAVWRGGAGFGGPALRPATVRSTLAGVVALGALLWSLWAVHSWSVALYRWGFAALALLTAVLVAAATRPGVLGRVLDLEPLAAIGRRSYGLYLWHWPVFVFTRPELDVPLTGGANIALKLGLTFVLSELSYQLVEQPVRRLGLRGGWRSLRSHSIGRIARPALVCTLVAVFASTGAVAAMSPQPKTAAKAAVTAAVEEPAPPSFAVPSATPSATSDRPTGSAPSAPSLTASPTSSTSSSPTPSFDGRTSDMTMTVFGDSFAIGAANGLHRRFKTATLHAKEGEQGFVAVSELDRLAPSLTTDIVLIHVGNNGVIDEVALAAAIAKIPTHSVVVLGLPRVPRFWQNEVLKQLRSVAARSPRVKVADWYSLANPHDDWFVDGVHPNGNGVREYGNLIQRTVLGE
ncbi:peptidoglycan O-acetyltransferase OatA [Yimella radicis]